MTDFIIYEMQAMQVKLQEKYKDGWEPITVDAGKNKLLRVIVKID